VVKLINTDGMSFIGPGSEWFWTAVSGIVLAVTFVAIWRQLALQRSASGYAQVTDLSRQDQAESMLRMKVKIYDALHDGCDPTQIPFGAASYVIDFWEDIAVLVREGHIDPRLVHESMGNGCRRWWATLQPFVGRVRAEVGPRGGEHFEWLAGQMAELDRKVGDTTIYDAEYLARTLDNHRRNASDRLRVAEELRGLGPGPADEVVATAAQTARPLDPQGQPANPIPSGDVGAG
jgi:hypothetical protein